MARFDGALIIELTNTKTSTSIHTDTVRPLGVFGLHETFVKRDIPSTVINYADYWDDKELLESILLWCSKHAVRRPVVACSTLFNTDIFKNNTTMYKVLTELKAHIDITIAVGGPDNHFSFDDLKPDVMFLGRTLHLFEHWIDGLPVRQPEIENGIPVHRPKDKEIVETPIVSKLYDDYCLMPTDVLNFETRLGCKFNCTFCSFPHRNAKDTQDSDPDALYEFFQTAKDKYGVTHFSCADDTINEDDSKLECLLSAVERLDYTPFIVGFTRFDIIANKPEQIELLDKCGIHAHFWGTETFHPVASKNIKKRLTKEKAFKTMQHVKENYPHWWTAASYITGLPGEPVEHCIETIDEIRKLQLVDSLSIIPLSITYLPGEYDPNASAFSMFPEKYGITLKKQERSYTWEHELCDEKTARIVAEKMSSKNVRKGLTNRGPWNHISEKAIGNANVTEHIDTYIAKKKIQMLD